MGFKKIIYVINYRFYRKLGIIILVINTILNIPYNQWNGINLIKSLSKFNIVYKKSKFVFVFNIKLWDYLNWGINSSLSSPLGELNSS